LGRLGWADRYDHVKNEWFPGGLMQYERSSCGVIYLPPTTNDSNDDAILAIGGKGQTEYLRSVERYSFITNAWTLEPYSLPVSLASFACQLVYGIIMVVGGKSDIKSYGLLHSTAWSFSVALPNDLVRVGWLDETGESQRCYSLDTRGYRHDPTRWKFELSTKLPYGMFDMGSVVIS
jgi:hypothetical protein